MAGLEVVTISGHAKAYDPRAASGIRIQRHAWNAVRLNGSWHTLDVTWATGYLSGRSFVRQFDPFWFLTPPEQMIFSHLPSEAKWQRLPRTVSKGQFRKLPRVRGSAFALAISAEQIRAGARARRFPGIVETFPLPEAVRINAAPVARVITAGTRYAFSVHAPAMEEVVVVDGDSWHPLLRDGETFAIEVEPQRAGRLLVMARGGAAAEFAPFLVYDVEAARSPRRGRLRE
jgi:hypothetical protein